jgi:lantibiotic transport system ATP-binding protein
MDSIIETQNLSHRFGAFQAVNALCLNVPKRAVYGFLGPNGSGKTTTIRLLLGLLRPQSGSVHVLGHPMPAMRKEIARSVGSLVETPCLYDHLSGFDNIDITRRAMGLTRAETGRVIDVVDLAPFAHQRAGSYSLGMRQRLGIARALLGSPKLLILDEPANGLDPAGVTDMRHLIRELPEKQDVTVFVSSHLLNEIEQIASHVGLMSKGRLIAQSALPDLLQSATGTLEIGVYEAPQALIRLQSAGLDASLAGPDSLSVHTKAPDSAALNALLVNAGFSVFSLNSRKPSLEEIFLTRTTGTAA